MPKFRKRPVVIEAFQMTKARRQDNREWPEWLNAAWQKEQRNPGAFWGSIDFEHYLYIRTLEGVLNVEYGDFIIQGVKGELYPCKPDIFEQTYEPVMII